MFPKPLLSYVKLRFAIGQVVVTRLKKSGGADRWLKFDVRDIFGHEKAMEQSKTEANSKPHTQSLLEMFSRSSASAVAASSSSSSSTSLVPPAGVSPEEKFLLNYGSLTDLDYLFEFVFSRSLINRNIIRTSQHDF